MLKGKIFKRIMSVALAVSMLVGTISVVASTTTKVVVAQDGYAGAEGETVYADIPAAINALGAAGGTIYVKGAVTTVAGLEDTATEHELVTIMGYTGADTDSLVITNAKSAIYGDITFKNLKVKAASMNTHNHKVTFGEGVTIESGTTLGFDSIISGQNDIFVIDAGSFNKQWMFQKWSGTYKKSADWTLNGGTIGTLVAGNYVGTGDNNTINGDIVLTQNGGTITDLYLGSQMQNNKKQTLTGNFIYTLNNGTVTNMHYGGYKKYNGTPNDVYNNIALIFNNATMTNAVTVKKDSGVFVTANLDMVILNNYENNKVSIEQNVADSMDYILKVTGGKAEPIFERTTADDPSTATFKGFKFTADGGRKYVPYVNGVQLEQKTGGLYDLSAFVSNGNTVEITFAEASAAMVVVAQDGYTAAEGEEVYTDIPAAINALGAAGGTIYVKGAVTTAAGLEDGTLTEHGLVTIMGYTGATEDSLKITTGTAAIYGDITFENLTVSGSSIATTNHTMTFGTGVVIGSDTLLSYGYATAGTTDTFVINAGTFGSQWLLQKWSGTYKKSYDWTLNGGTISSLVMGNYVGSGDATTINGDIVLTQNGGTITTLDLGSQMPNNKVYTLKGDFIYTLNDGSVTNLNYGGYKKYNGTTQDVYNNMAFIFNNASMTNAVTLKRRDSNVRPTANVDMLILNNYEVNKVTVDSGVASRTDYILKVTGGKAEPVFERTTADDPSTSTLKGFKLTADQGSSYVPFVSGTKLSKNSEGYYDLSALKSEGTAIEISFGPATPLEDYVNFRNPFTNSYDKLRNGEEVNVVYFGGSMTAGYGSSNSSTKSWRGLTMQWFNTNFPNATINHTSLSLGESGTYMGTFRTPHDVINTEPDILFIEYSINDRYFGATYDQAASQFETIIREVKLAHPNCDIVTILVTDEQVVLNTRDGKLHTQAQAHEDISAQYGIPSINVGKALADRFEGITELTLGDEWNKYSMNDGDIVHLNDTGYAIYFGPIEAFLETVFSGDDTKSYDNAASFPSEIVSMSLFDGNRTIIDGEKAIIVEQSDKTPVTNTAVNLNSILTASNNNGGSGFTFNPDGRIFGSTYSYAENYKGTLQLKAGTAGKLVAEFSGTELAIFGNMSTNDKFKYSIVRKADGDVIEDSATCTVGGTRPTQVFKNLESDTYIVTLEFASSANDLVIGAIMTRDASMQTTYEKPSEFYVKYGGTGNGTSPENPARSVAWLINNTIANYYTADEEVEIYIMQDDAEILYNSTIYETTDESYSAPIVGNNNAPAAHFTAWTSDADGTKASHKATIVIKSYEDGTSQQNYLGYVHGLGRNAQLVLQGPTVFDNISLVTCYNDMVGILADGYDMTFNSAFKIYSISANRYWSGTSAKAWNGQFNEITPYYTSIGIGDETGNSPSGLGGKLVFNKAIKNQWLTADNSSSRIIFGDATDGAVFKEDVSLYVNSAAELNIRIGSGNNNKNTFEKNMNLLINFASARIDFNANSTSYTDVKGAVQVIRNSTARVTGFDAIVALKPEGGYWNLKTNNGTNEQFIDVTDVAGKFSVADGKTVIAINTATGEVTLAKNGVLDLTASQGEYDVRCLEYEETTEAYINLGKAVYVKENTTIDLADVTPNTKEGYAFLGWKKADGTLPAMSNGTVTATLSAGTLLIADYAKYSVDKDGDFFIKEIEMRTSDGSVPSALRFVVELKKSLTELVGGESKLVEYGSLILPLEFSGGKDIRYNTPICKYDGTVVGTPKAVPAKNIYQETDETMLYTVAVADISADKYNRFYSVQGYVRYIDANGVERVLYSEYAQSSMYKAALELAADAEASTTAIAEAKVIIDYVEKESFNDYNALYSKTKLNTAQNINNFEVYKYSNGLNVSEYTLNWYNNDNLTEVVQLTDTHFVYLSEEDVFNAYEPTLTTYVSGGRQWYESINPQSNALRVMKYASFADKTIVTGDEVDYVSEGTMQVAERLLWGMNTAVGIRANALGTSSVLATVGNHENMETLDGVDNGKSVSDILADVQKKWCNDITFHSEMVYNAEGKNGVMVVLIDNIAGSMDSTVPGKLADAINVAKQNNAPVLLFMHSLISDGSDDTTVPEVFLTNQGIAATGKAQKNSIDNTTRMGGSAYTNANGLALYSVITENADTIRGIFVGHEHGYMYNEVAGTGAAANYTIPQFILGAAHLDGGYALKINIK